MKQAIQAMKAAMGIRTASDSIYLWRYYHVI